MATQYKITPIGYKALVAGDHLLHLANEAAEDGIVSASEITKLSPQLTETDAEYVLSILRRLGFIEPAPVQGVKYNNKFARRYIG